ncbi:MAG: hypothetical protein QN122_13930, partial [Armatimonadota bacterium]|nr:hypothetical protein [Armatimonadota bacterium]
MRRALAREPWLTHLTLLVGVMVFAFPVYVAFVGSTHDLGTVARGEMGLRPGPHLVDTYGRAWRTGTGERVQAPPVRRMMRNSLIMALTIATGKIAISLLSAFAPSTAAASTRDGGMDCRP